MIIWIILIIAWAGILAAGISLFRVAGYADRKLRRSLAERARRREDQAA
jgi:hypothetical protein